MNYEKELWDAGFPFTDLDKVDAEKVFMVTKGGKAYRRPLLHELIEACGIDGSLFRMNNVDGPWSAETDKNGRWSYGHGSTPEEAVAMLWLALNPHPTPMKSTSGEGE